MSAILRVVSDLLRPRRRKEPFVKVTIGFPAGLTPEITSTVCGALDALDPEWWCLANPFAILAWFRSARSGAARAESFRAAVERMRGARPSWSGLVVTCAEGSPLAQFDRLGRVTSMPLGFTTETPWPEARS